MNDFVTLAHGARIAYSVLGSPDAPPLLLLRPLGGSMDLWGAFRDALAERFRVVSFDPRGVGESSDAPWFHSTRRMARDAIAVLDHARLERVDVFGLSLGGMVATWLAVDAAPRVNRLVLAGTLSRATASSGSPAMLKRVRAWAAAFFKKRAHMEGEIVRHVLSDRFQRDEPDRVHAIVARVRARPTSRRNFAMHLMAALTHDATRVLASIQAPTLLIYGDHDPIANARARSEMKERIPHAASIVVPNVGHDLSLEAPHLVAEQIMSWLESAIDGEVGPKRLAR